MPMGGDGGSNGTQQMQMRNAKTDSDRATALTAINQVGATALAFIPYVGPLLSALASGVGAAANAKAQEDAKKKMQAAQEGPVGGGSAMGVIQAPQIGMAPGSQNQPDQMGSFLSSLGQTRQSGGFA